MVRRAIVSAPNRYGRTFNVNGRIHCKRSTSHERSNGIRNIAGAGTEGHQAPDGDENGRPQKFASSGVGAEGWPPDQSAGSDLFDGE